VNAYSPRYDGALAFAARAHRNQLRKGTDIPYIAHPAAVSVILLRHGFGEDLAVAGLLHDVVEDCDVTLAELEARFGRRVAELVGAVSETKHADGIKRPWEERKAEKLAHLRAGGAAVAALKAADALHNAHSVLRDVRADGPGVWNRFNRGAASTINYYREVTAAVREALGDHPLALELAAAVEELAALPEG
jgi:(p)ppGpp synthase/HD superfamily hydrolase